MNVSRASRGQILSLLAATSVLTSCGGGGGGGSASSPTVGGSYLVRANVTSDTCGERIANITQVFTFTTANEQRAVDTTVNVVPVTDSDAGTTFSYSERNGDCVRTYSGVFADLNDPTAEVKLTSKSQCGSSTCQSDWVGTASPNQTKSSEQLFPRVSGENCVPPTDDLFYRPSAFECNGNAFVGMISDRFRDAFSVVLRANGFRNDRDPDNPECGLAECSPYKTQKIVQLPQHQIRCLGDNGFSAKMRRAQRISIKFIPVPSEADKQDPLKFEQYCLADTSAYLN